MTGIKRLAEHLNLSIGTVSRALNGKPDVNEATRQRVLEAARQIGYVPNQSGRALRRGATGIIGFMIESGTQASVDDGDTFFLTVFDGVQSVLEQNQLDLVALLCGARETPHEYLQRVVGRGFVDGLIISATHRRDPRIDLLADRNLPFIALGRSLTDRGHAWYDLDFEGMAETAVRRLAGKGHRRIALVSNVNSINLNFLLLDSYRASLEAVGLPFDPGLVLRGSPDQAGGYAIAQQALRMADRPTAILLANEVMSIGLYRGLLEAGVVPGRDIAVIGRASPHARFLSPTLTAFDTSLRDLGAALARGLLATIPAYQQAYPQGIERQIWPMRLIEGESDAFTLDAPALAPPAARKRRPVPTPLF